METKKRWSWPVWIGVAIAIPVLYILSIGPACWLTRAGILPFQVTKTLCRPIIAMLIRSPEWVWDAAGWYPGGSGEAQPAGPFAPSIRKTNSSGKHWTGLRRCNSCYCTSWRGTNPVCGSQSDIHGLSVSHADTIESKNAVLLLDGPPTLEPSKVQGFDSVGVHVRLPDSTEKKFGSECGSGDRPGLQNRRSVVLRRLVGSIPIRSRLRFEYR